VAFPSSFFSCHDFIFSKKNASSETEMPSASKSKHKAWQGPYELKCRFSNGPTKAEPNLNKADYRMDSDSYQYQ
jgi:hypothetical protein